MGALKFDKDVIILFIKNIDRYVSQIVHNDIVHKVVEGIADVPRDVRNHLVQFPEWSDVVEPVKNEIIEELHKVEEVEVEEVVGGQNNGQTDNTQTTGTENDSKKGSKAKPEDANK